LIPYGKHNVRLTEALKVAWQVRFRSLTQGSRIDEFEKKVAQYVGANYAVAVSSATAGLHLAMLALDLPQKSKVITSPISFVASANSILYAGHRPVFIDIDNNTVNLDLDLIESQIRLDPEVRAIIPVHFAGLPCDMRKLSQTAKANGIRIIEDAAHALGASYQDGQKVGSCSFSDMTVFSFHPVKSITTGEGGMITTNDYDLYKKLIRLRSHGINKLDDEFRNQILSTTAGEANPWYYEMIELGFNFRLTEIQAVLGISQMKRLEHFIIKRARLSKNYQELLKNSSKISLAQKGQIIGSANHIFPIRINFSATKQSRNKLMTLLKEKGITTQVHYIPIPAQPYYQQLGYSISDIPNAFSYYEETLTIPLFPSLRWREQRKIFKLLEDLI
jgi:perosamine synthetase